MKSSQGFFSLDLASLLLLNINDIYNPVNITPSRLWKKTPTRNRADHYIIIGKLISHVNIVILHVYVPENIIAMAEKTAKGRVLA